MLSQKQREATPSYSTRFGNMLSHKGRKNIYFISEHFLISTCIPVARLSQWSIGIGAQLPAQSIRC